MGSWKSRLLSRPVSVGESLASVVVSARRQPGLPEEQRRHEAWQEGIFERQWVGASLCVLIAQHPTELCWRGCPDSVSRKSSSLSRLPISRQSWAFCVGLRSLCSAACSHLWPSENRWLWWLWTSPGVGVSQTRDSATGPGLLLQISLTWV